VRRVPADVIDFDPKSLVKLVGPPGRMSGTFRVRNKHDKRIVITEGLLRYPEPGSAGKGEAGEFEGAVRMTAIVPPGHSADVRSRACLPASTPPGRYRAALTLGDSTYPVELLVTEFMKTKIAPAQIFVPGAAGYAQKNIVVSNHGNVRVTVGSFGALPLDDELAMCRIIRAALKNAPANTETVHQWTTVYLRTAGDHLEHLGMLWVDAERGPIIVEPGQSVPVTLRIRIPENLPASRCYAVATFYDTSFQIVVVPTGAAVLRKDPAVLPKSAAEVRRPK
jgi:hypothetical protein